jgi:hypothetical protein
MGRIAWPFGTHMARGPKRVEDADDPAGSRGSSVGGEGRPIRDTAKVHDLAREFRANYGAAG